MNDTETDITRVLETLASRQPEAPALHVPGRTSLTYADLGEQIRYVRERLGEWNIHRGDIVAGVIPLRPEMAVACATLPAAATFTPLSPAFTTDVYAELLARLRPKALLLPKGLDLPVRIAARHCGVAEIELVADPSAPAGMFTLELARQEQSLRNDARVSREIAYVMCTSGTTGRHKLVPSVDRKLILTSRSLCDWFGLSPSDLGCHIQPLHLGSGLNGGLMVPLLRGSSLVCLPESDVDALIAALDAYRPTWLIAGFTIYRAILERAPARKAVFARSRVRFLRAVSGRLESDEIERIERLFSAPVLVGLNSSETHTIALEPLPPRVRKRGSVGLPMVNEVALIDEGGALCGTDRQGEIVVRGPLVFDGYLDDPQATANAFTNGWFRTGDLGRFDDDGYLFLQGRVKDIINRGGEKISPAEIDSAIEALPEIRAAAAFGVPHPTLGEEIVAAVVKHDNAVIDASAIVERVRQRMGSTRVPRRIYFLDALPRTETGKLLRSKLPDLLGLDEAAFRASDESATVVPPSTNSALESALIGLWASVLRVSNVGVNDDFFRIGGSLPQGAELLDHVKAVFGVELRAELLSREAGTVTGMAQAIETARSRTPAANSGADGAQRTGPPRSIPRRQKRTAAPLSHTQLRMWFLARLDPDDASYNQGSAFRLTGAIDIEALQGSVRYLVERHEILRTSYTLVDGEPRQIVHEDLAVEMKCSDLGTMPEERQSEAMQRLLLDEARRIFDLQSGPVLRLLLVRLSARDHVLLRVTHHIASDGWSSGIFERELSAAYAAFVEGREPQLPALPIQYADYAAWQREWLQSEALQAQLGYWKAKLAALPTLQLPTDRPRPPIATHKGAVCSFDLPAALMHALKALGRREGSTLFMTLLAAFQVLLYRYSGHEDIAVGTPIAGRGRTDLEGLIGFFANTLVLRSDLSGNPSFRELLSRVRETALGAYTHQHLPFEKLVEELAPARDMSRNPLFQVSFALQNAPAGALAFAGVEVRRMPLEVRSAKFDLYLAVRESATGLHGRWEYATDLFDAATIERMSGHFAQLLEAIVADPEQRIGHLPLLSAAERQQLLVEWNDTAADYPRDRCIQQLFEEQVARSPDAVAIVCEDEQITYAELNARANQLAHYLVKRGVGPEVLVGICLERSIELIVGLIAILKAGGAYVPLDPAYPQERLAFMLEDTQAPVLITQQHLIDLLPAYETHLLCIDRDWNRAIATQPDSNPACRTAAESLAYVIYTSGSSGRPKGAMVMHRGLTNVAEQQRRTFGVHPGDQVLQFASPSFDASVFETLMAFCAGGTLHLLTQGSLRAGVALCKWLQDRAITHATLPPSVLEATDPLELPTLKTLIVAGEACSRDLVGVWAVGRRLFNAYGPTEATIWSTVAECAVADERRPSIGRPIANTRIYVLDRHGQPVPLKVAGELCIGGDGLARGYLNRPALTAEKFLPDPFSCVQGARMYRTGDLARYLPGGNIEFLGRIDDQVKIRGFRVEPGEIEAILEEHTAVRQAVVLAREDGPGDKRLVAYVVPSGSPSIDAQVLRAHLGERLPEYMRPAAYVLLEQLPLTTNGKIDREALPTPQYGRAGSGDMFVAARNPLEELITEVWCEVLKLERVGVHDNFFALGGHSLLAAQVAARFAKLVNIELPLRRIFEAPTIADLARDVARMSRGTTSLEQILREVEVLSDEEAARQLACLESTRNPG